MRFWNKLGRGIGSFVKNPKQAIKNAGKELEKGVNNLGKELKKGVNQLMEGYDEATCSDDNAPSNAGLAGVHEQAHED